MKALIQRTTKSSVAVDGEVIGEIGCGVAVLLGITVDDTKKEAEILAKKMCELRIFADSDDKLNLSLLDMNGEALIISQFTLCADCRKGRRPSFIKAKNWDEAQGIYEYFCACVETMGVKKVARGRFGADMKVSILNDGPVTIMLDTQELKPQKGEAKLE